MFYVFENFKKIGLASCIICCGIALPVLPMKDADFKEIKTYSTPNFIPEGTSCGSELYISPDKKNVCRRIRTTLLFWNLVSGKRLRTLAWTDAKHDQIGSLLHIFPSNNNDYFLAIPDGFNKLPIDKISAFDIKQAGEKPSDIDFLPFGLTVSHDEKYAATVEIVDSQENPGILKIYDIAGKDTLTGTKAFKSIFLPNWQCHNLQFFDDNKTVLFRYKNNFVTVDVKTGETRRFNGPQEICYTHAIISHDGNYVVFAHKLQEYASSSPYKFFIYNLKEEKIEDTFKSEISMEQDPNLAFFPNNRYFASYSDQKIIIWDIEKKGQCCSIKVKFSGNAVENCSKMGNADAMTISNDGSLIVVADETSYKRENLECKLFECPEWVKAKKTTDDSLNILKK